MRKAILVLSMLALCGCDQVVQPRAKVERVFPKGEIQQLPIYDCSSKFVVRLPNGDIVYADAGGITVTTNVLFHGQK